MNIFVTDTSPIISAGNLDDTRLRKMIIETAQLLSTALWRADVRDKKLYKHTKVTHPCTLWAWRTRGNFEWLLEHGFELSRIYSSMSSKIHLSDYVIRRAGDLTNRIKRGDLQPFCNCTPIGRDDNGKEEDILLSTVEKYRQYLNEKWDNDLHPPRWTHRSPPIWR